MAGVHQARAAGASVTAQVAGRPVGVILGIATSLNPFAVRERYKPFEALPLSERLCRLRDPAVRRAILDDRPSSALLSRFGPLVQFAAGQDAPAGAIGSALGQGRTLPRYCTVLRADRSRR